MPLPYFSNLSWIEYAPDEWLIWESQLTHALTSEQNIAFLMDGVRQVGHSIEIKPMMEIMFMWMHPGMPWEVRQRSWNKMDVLLQDQVRCAFEAWGKSLSHETLTESEDQMVRALFYHVDNPTSLAKNYSFFRGISDFQLFYDHNIPLSRPQRLVNYDQEGQVLACVEASSVIRRMTNLLITNTSQFKARMSEGILDKWCDYICNHPIDRFSEDWLGFMNKISELYHQPRIDEASLGLKCLCWHVIQKTSPSYLSSEQQEKIFGRDYSSEKDGGLLLWFFNPEKRPLHVPENMGDFFRAMAYESSLHQALNSQHHHEGSVGASVKRRL